MMVVNYSKARNKLKEYCDKVCEGETVYVTRKSDRNVVIMSADRYEDMQRIVRNAAYTEKLDRAFEQLDAGQGTAHELIED